MTIAKITAVIRCDGCAKPFDITLDPAQKMQGSCYESIDQYVDDLIRAGDTFVFSIQGEHQLCKPCTAIVDDAYPEDPISGLTYDMVKRVLDNAAGV